MGYTIYIQQYNGTFPGDQFFSAFEGFTNRNLPIRFFEEIDEVPVNKNNIVIGFIEDTQKYFQKLGIKTPNTLHIPKEFIYEWKKVLKRKIRYITLGELKENLHKFTFPIFIKSVELKKIISGPIKTENDFKIFTFNDSNDLEIILSDYVNFISEYRCFIHDKKLVGIKHYIGDFTVFPEVDIITKCIEIYSKSPIAYTIDVGVTDRGETLLIECNDMWSIGHYGLDSSIYSKMLFDRWLEIVTK